MGTLKCPDCGKEISELAPSCIGCGRPMSIASVVKPNPPGGSVVVSPNPKGKGSLFLAVAGVVVVGIVALWVLGGFSNKATAEARLAIDSGELRCNPDTCTQLFVLGAIGKPRKESIDLLVNAGIDRKKVTFNLDYQRAAYKLCDCTEPSQIQIKRSVMGFSVNP